jgi:hypothetical protein
MTWPHIETHDWERKPVLKYRVGDEKAETLVLYSSVVTPDADARRLVDAGTILCEITSGAGAGKYGPYDATAADGRQTIGSTHQCFVLLTGKDCTLGDRAVEGLWMDCVFRKDTLLDVNNINAADLSSLQAAFPQASFR